MLHILKPWDTTGRDTVCDSDWTGGDEFFSWDTYTQEDFVAPATMCTECAERAGEMLDANMRVVCDNCGAWAPYDVEGDLDREWFKPLGEVEDLSERIDPGSTVPYGECRACGALAYIETGISDGDRAIQTLKNIREILHPTGDPDHEWSPDTLDQVDEQVLNHFGVAFGFEELDAEKLKETRCCHHCGYESEDFGEYSTRLPRELIAISAGDELYYECNDTVECRDRLVEALNALRNPAFTHLLREGHRVCGEQSGAATTVAGDVTCPTCFEAVEKP